MGEGLAFDAAWLFAGLLILFVAVAVVLAARRYWLERGGGTVECGLRPPGRGPWRLGVASYQRDELLWHGALGVALRPEHAFRRRSLEVTSRRQPEPSECTVLAPDAIIIEVKAGPAEDPVELAMTDQALTGFLAWLEAAPPGSHLEDL